MDTISIEKQGNIKDNFARCLQQIYFAFLLICLPIPILWLNYILPFCGVVMLFLVFKSLRKENKYFKLSFYIVILYLICLFLKLILYACLDGVLFIKAFEASFFYIFKWIVFILFLVCFKQGLLKIQSNLEKKNKLFSMNVWLIVFLLLALEHLFHSNDTISHGLYTISFFLVIYSFIRMSKDFNNLMSLGLGVRVSVKKYSNFFFAILISLLLIMGIYFTYNYGGSYPMQWQEMSTDTVSESQEVLKIKQKLLSKGFPERVLQDICTEDVKKCVDCINVKYAITVFDFTNYYAEEKVYKDQELDTIDANKLYLTGIIVDLVDENSENAKDYIVFQHFLWGDDIIFYGTESIAIQSYDKAENISGRVLYNDNNKKHSSNFYKQYLTKVSTGSDIFGNSDSTNGSISNFSFPKAVKNARGYVSYRVKEEWISGGISSDLYYTHQVNKFLYPVKTAERGRLYRPFFGEKAFNVFHAEVNMPFH